MSRSNAVEKTKLQIVSCIFAMGQLTSPVSINESLLYRKSSVSSVYTVLMQGGRLTKLVYRDVARSVRIDGRKPAPQPDKERHINFSVAEYDPLIRHSLRVCARGRARVHRSKASRARSSARAVPGRATVPSTTTVSATSLCAAVAAAVSLLLLTSKSAS